MQPTTSDERERQAKEMLRALRQRSQSPQYAWGGDLSVEAGLLLEGSRFEFVQAMRLLTRIAHRLAGARASGVETSQAVTLKGADQPADAPALPEVDHAPEDAVLGEEAEASRRLPAMDEPEQQFSIRLRSRISLAISPASVHRIYPALDDGGGIEVIANLLALAGQNAPLPEPYTEMLLERQSQRDLAMTDFLDIFHHRLLELYFKSTLHTAPWLQWKHPATNDLAQMLYALCGLGPADLRDRMEVPDRLWLRYAGLLFHRPRPVAGFEQIVRDHFKVPAKAAGAVGRWHAMEPEDVSRVGRETCRLGQTATLGRRVWLREAGLRLQLGPMRGSMFESFLPHGARFRQLQAMAKFYFDDAVTLDLHLELHSGDERAASLGGARLGWTSWVRPPKGAVPLRLRVPFAAERRSGTTERIRYTEERRGAAPLSAR